MIRLALRQALVLLAIALVPAAISGAWQLEWRTEQPLAPGEIRAGTARLWRDKVIWVDARSRGRFEAGHISGAVRLDETEWEAQLPQVFAIWEAGKVIVVYGEDVKDPVPEKIAARLRNEAKFESVYVLKGGWAAWRRG